MTPTKRNMNLTVHGKKYRDQRNEFKETCDNQPNLKCGTFYRINDLVSLTNWWHEREKRQGGKLSYKRERFKCYNKTNEKGPLWLRIDHRRSRIKAEKTGSCYKIPGEIFDKDDTKMVLDSGYFLKVLPTGFANG